MALAAAAMLQKLGLRIAPNQNSLLSQRGSTFPRGSKYPILFQDCGPKSH